MTRLRPPLLTALLELETETPPTDALSDLKGPTMLEGDAIAEALGAVATRYPGRSIHFVALYDAVQAYLWSRYGITVPLSDVKRVCRMAGIRVARPAEGLPQEAWDLVLTADLPTVSALDGAVW